MNVIKNYEPDFAGCLYGLGKKKLLYKLPCKHDWKTSCERCSHTYWVVEGEAPNEGVCDVYLRENPKSIIWGS